VGELLGRHYALSWSARFWDRGPAGPTMRAIGDHYLNTARGDAPSAPWPVRYGG
jgi:hypothetical protein